MAPEIAFVSERDGDKEIYAMGADGSGEVNLTNDPGLDSMPAWSPDGSRIAFGSDRGGNLDIYVMNADGSDLTQLTDHGGQDAEPTWSPDGTEIVFDSDREKKGTPAIHVMNADGSGVKRLTASSDPEGFPAWSPTGDIAFVRFIERFGVLAGEIYVMEADGTGARRLLDRTKLLTIDIEPSWSPDGSTIAFASIRKAGRGIFLMDADGANLRAFWVEDADGDVDATGPSWSPDGARIAFDSEMDGNFEIYSANVDGTGIEQLTDDSGEDRQTDWSRTAGQ